MKKYFLTKFNALIILGLLLPAFLNAQIPQDFIFWKFSAGAFHNAPFVNDSVVYCSNSDGNFYALNIKNGTEIWNYKSGHPSYSNPALSNGVICFEADERLYGLETKTGKLLWSYVASDKIPTPGSPTGYHHSSPVIYNNVAYYGDEWGNLNGININTGELVFQYTTKTLYTKASDKFIRSTAAIKDDIIYIGDYGRNIYAISLKDSSEKWIHKIESPKWDGSIVSEIVIKDNVLYFGGCNNTFSPIDLNTGNPIWSFTDPNTFLPSTPLFYEDNVIMGTTINSNKIHVSENWLKTALFGFSISCFIVQFGRNLGHLAYPESINWPFIGNLAFFLYFNVLFYVAISSQTLLNKTESKEKYKNSPIDEETGLLLIQQLDSYMLKNKPFKDPELSLKGLASSLNFSERYLSQIINEHKKQNFSDFINLNRIEYAMNLLKNPANKQRTMLDILFESGFNSKTAFNVAFKKFAGCTPSEYKKKMLTTQSIE